MPKECITQIDLSSYVKESTRRNENVQIYLVNETTGDVIAVSINPHFVAGIVKTGLKTNRKMS